MLSSSEYNLTRWRMPTLYFENLTIGVIRSWSSRVTKHGPADFAFIICLYKTPLFIYDESHTLHMLSYLFLFNEYAVCYVGEIAKFVQNE